MATCVFGLVLLAIASTASAIKTHGGTANGASCVFPFIYRGKTYNKCTKASYSGNWDDYWCATVKDYAKDGKKWGYCITPKPTTGKPVTTTRKTTTVKTTRPPTTTKTTPKVCTENVCKPGDISVGDSCYRFLGSSKYADDNAVCKKQGATIATLKNGSAALKAVAAAAWKHPGWNGAGGYIRVSGKQGNKCATLRGTNRYTTVQYLTTYCNKGAAIVCQTKSVAKTIPCGCTKRVCKNAGEFLAGNNCYKFLGSSKQKDDKAVCQKQGATLANLKNGSAELKAVAAKAWAHKGWNGPGGYIRVNGVQGNKCATLRGTNRYTTVQYLTAYCNKGAAIVCQSESSCETPKKPEPKPKVCTKHVCKNSGDIQVGSTCYRFLGSSKYADDNAVCQKQGGTIANLKNGSPALKAVAAKAWAHPGWNGSGGYIRVSGKQGNKCATLRGTNRYTTVQYLTTYCNKGAAVVCQFKSESKTVPCCTKNVCKNAGEFLAGNTCYKFLGSSKQKDDNAVCQKQGATIANLKNGSAELKAVAAKAWAHKGWNGPGGYIRVAGTHGNTCATLRGSNRYTTVQNLAAYCNKSAAIVCQSKSQQVPCN